MGVFHAGTGIAEFFRMESNEELWEPAAERGRTHPILIAAGVAVLLFSLLGAAALTGFLPIGNTRLSQDAQPPFAVGDRVRIVNGASLERA